MPADIPPFPEGQDPDQTIAYRSPQPQPSNDAHTRQWPHPEELGYAPVPPTPAKRGRGWIIALVAALLVGVVGGGGVWAASMLSGGGTQPHEVLPGNAIGYLRLDLDPAANQKLALLNIARKFSATKDVFAGDDPRKALFEEMRKGVSAFAELDFAKDVEPWLGDRIGAAILAPARVGSEPDAVVAIQVKDEAAAKTAFAKLDSGTEGTKAGVVFREGYVIIAENQEKADRYAGATPLSENERFTGDLDALGEPGVLSFWADLGAIAENTGKDQNPAVTDLVRNARFTGALRFGDDYAELTGFTRGIETTKTDAKPLKLGELPASTAGAIGISGLGAILGEQWPKIQKAVESADRGAVARLSQETGLALPGDLITLLGEGVTAAVDAEGLNAEQPNVGVVLHTDPAKARAVLNKLETAASGNGATPQLVKVDGDDKLVVAASQDYANKLNSEGTLGDSEAFRLAVPGAQDATFGLYADLDKVEPLYLKDVQGDSAADLQMLRAVGLSGRVSDEGAGFLLRVVFN
ncbi:DUF3352 domain-containing protein [Microtetraspora sp. NBRC 16547]|uniref:DUF3352 domain-containing protein n=1 Tax=Microtetraspora sp. NBRC 16547 TaxID=3030993 RepID=UPI0024A2A7ED|nr:DUF3352 domain-containing protein [Microtetraspora sp. NBRC 16547]GLX01265.1 hypothetical protein Misp02_53510 [Microtetraspora sp. NBRC 16547]